MKHTFLRLTPLQTLLPIAFAVASSLAVGQSSMKTTNDGGIKETILCDVPAPKPPNTSRQGTNQPRGTPPSLRIGSTTTWRVVPDQPGKVSYCVIPTVEALGATWTTPVTLMLVDKRTHESPDENPNNPAVFTGLTMQERIWSPPKTAVVAVPIAAGTKLNVATSPAWCESNIFWYKRPELVIETDSGVSCRVRFGARDNRVGVIPTKDSSKPEKSPAK